MFRFHLIICMIALASALTALSPAFPGAASGACETQSLRTASVAQVIDGQTLRLADGGGVRLIGALAPESPRWWKGPKPWPPAERARRALERLIGSSKVELRFAADEEKRDRHDRFLAQLFVLRDAERIWAQGHMIRRGLAQAYSFKGHRACARALQAFERQARAARAGLWRSGTFAILRAGDVDALSKRRGGFQLVEGKLSSVAHTRGWTFLNFGADWRTDFTVAIRAGDRARFRNSDVVLDRLEGKTLRVRGWIERWNGPAIKATHPEQITIVGESGEPASGNRR